jgi:SAM-dependent methyltransferase
VNTTVEVVTSKGSAPVKVTRPRLTGVGDAAWTYGQREITEAVYSEAYPATFPFTAADFKRLDEAPDSEFYKFPKLVYHIDEGAVSALTRYYDKQIADGSDVLDICSSWVSHYPRDFPGRMKSIAGVGISGIELACNDQLSSYVAQDLNQKPKLPFPDRSFDVVTCVVSFDYLTRPLEVMKEVARVLRPNGQLILSQSNRCFFTKAVGVWTRDMSDAAHLRVLGTYIHFAGALSEPQAFDISPRGPGTNDPMYIVRATRQA